MFYRVHADLPFTDSDEANDFYHDCQVALPKASTIHPGEETEERGTILYEQCFHDETPPKPCLVIDEAQTAD